MGQRAWRAVIPDEAAEASGALVGRTRVDRGLGREHGCQQRGPGCVRTDDSRASLAQVCPLGLKAQGSRKVSAAADGQAQLPGLPLWLQPPSP